MKMTLGRVLRSATTIGFVVAAGAMVTGCGSDSSNPEAVTVDQLKYPGDLQITDLGNGSVKLSWVGANNEDDFDGYNIYGMKGSQANLGVTDGEPIQLLDGEGNALQAARDILLNFNYDPTKKFEEPGTTEAAEGEDAPEFKALPVHTLTTGDDAEPLLPTCKDNGSGTCVLTTKTNFGEASSLSGLTSYTVEGLTVGEQYCFFILSSMDKGKKVSSTSSAVQCITPAYSGAFALSLPTATNNNRAWLLTDYLAECVAADDGCELPSATTYKVDAGSHDSEDTDELYIEFSSSAGPSLVAGKNSAIADLGEYTGFDDATLPASPSTLTLDTNLYDSGADGGTNKKTPIFNQGGYSIAGQTAAALKKNHIYVIAAGDAAATNPTEFLYVWLWVKDTVPASGGSVDVEVRIPKSKM